MTKKELKTLVSIIQNNKHLWKAACEEKGQESEYAKMCLSWYCASRQIYFELTNKHYED